MAAVRAARRRGPTLPARARRSRRASRGRGAAAAAPSPTARRARTSSSRRPDTAPRPSACSPARVTARPDGSLVDRLGRPLPGIRTIGLGSGSRRSPLAGGEPSYTGPVDGVWHYQTVRRSGDARGPVRPGAVGRAGAVLPASRFSGDPASAPPASRDEEGAVVRHLQGVAAPEPTRLEAELVEPAQVQPQRPGGVVAETFGEVVEVRAAGDHDGHVQPVAVGGDPPLLQRGGQADPQDVRPRRVDRVDGRELVLCGRSDQGVRGPRPTSRGGSRPPAAPAGAGPASRRRARQHRARCRTGRCARRSAATAGTGPDRCRRWRAGSGSGCRGSARRARRPSRRRGRGRSC